MYSKDQDHRSRRGPQLSRILAA